MRRFVSSNKKRAEFGVADLFNRPWFITRAALESMVAGFMSGRPRCDYDDYEDDPGRDDGAPYDLTDDGLATLRIDAPLSQDGCWCGCRIAYSDVAAAHLHAIANPAVKGICTVYDSPGGEACSDWLELTDNLYRLRGQKPTVAISYDACYSAAYCLASAADALFVARLGGVGSIGCWTAHVDYSELLKNEGIKVTYVFAGAKKVDGNSTEPLSDSARAEMKDSVDRIRDQFVSAVARNRGVSADALYETEAGCFTAELAIPLLADRVGSLEDAHNWLRSQIAAKAPAADAPGNKEEIDGLASAQAAADGGVAPGGALVADADGVICLDKRAMAEALNAGLPRLRAEYPEAIVAVREFRAVSEVTGDNKIRLLIAPYGSAANLGDFEEQYRPGCFDASLSGDLRVLTNHAESRAYVLGRVSAGTARFWSDAAGVHAEATPPNTQWARDLAVSMKRGDIKDASAAFYILKQSREVKPDGRVVRWVEKGLLVDGSVESFGAYPGARSEVVESAPQAAPAQEAVANDNEARRRRIAILRLR